MSFYNHPNVKGVSFELEPHRDGSIKEYVVVETDLATDRHDLDFDQPKHDSLMAFLIEMLNENDRFDCLRLKQIRGSSEE